MLEQFKITFDAREDCGGCGLWIRSGYRVQGVGSFCSVECIETELFGGSRCRWCGGKIEKKPYLSIDSRLCSEDCKTNYHAHAIGDRSAKLGSGRRFLLWLQANRPAIYSQMAEAKAEPRCPECGGSLATFRAGTVYDSEACRQKAHRKSQTTLFEA